MKEFKYYGAVNGHLAEVMLEGLNLTALFPHVGHPVTLWKRRAMWLEDALAMFTDNVADPPADWVPLLSLPSRVTQIVVILMPLEPGKRANRPSLTSDVLVFRENVDGLTDAAQSVALLPFTAALYQNLLQFPFGIPSRTTRVLQAFTPHVGRGPIASYLDSYPEFSMTVPEVKPIWRPKMFLETAKSVSFVMSPPGFGFDCYRTWEALSVGAIPIVMDPETSFAGVYHLYVDDSYKHRDPLTDPSAMLEVFKDLPVVVVKDVSEITLENLQRWQSEIYGKMQRGEYHLEKLFAQTWLDQIYAHRQPVGR